MLAIKLAEDDFAAVMDNYVDITALNNIIANTGLLLDQMREQRFTLGFELAEHDFLKPDLYSYAWLLKRGTIVEAILACQDFINELRLELAQSRAILRNAHLKVVPLRPIDR